MGTVDLFADPTNIVTGLTTLANSGDVLFLVLMGTLVFAMQLGFALLEGGQVRKKNVNNVMMKNMTDWLIGAVSWLFIGSVLAVSLVPGDFISWWGQIVTTDFADNGLGLANWFFGLVFAATAATIVSGGVAERIKFKSYILMSILITAFIYPLFVYLSPWGSGTLPFNDYAGSFIVHGLGGFLRTRCNCSTRSKDWKIHKQKSSFNSRTQHPNVSIRCICSCNWMVRI